MGPPVQTIVLILLAATSTLADEASLEVKQIELNHSNGFGNEIIQTKLDVLEYRFTELFVQLKEQGEAFLNNQRRVESEQRLLNQIVERHASKITNLIIDLENSFGTNVTQISDQSRQILELQTICSNHDAIRSELFELRPKSVTQIGMSDVGPEELTADEEVCSDVKMSGPCRMRIGSEDTIVYREQVRFGGNWTVVLQRYDGSEPFNRNWTEYRDGFGTVGKEFWIGLERLHLLTKDSTHELAVELEDFAGNYSYARYDRFSVGSEADKYPLSELGEYRGTAGDSLRNHVEALFETDDSVEYDCARKFGHGGGWFFDAVTCFNAHFMGKWQNVKDWDSIIWETFEPTSAQTPMKFIRMMVRKV